MSTPLTGFTVRGPRPEELPAMEPWFAASQLGWRQCLIRGAFGQPGDVPLGGVIVRPTRNNTVGQFTIFVRPEFRRHGVGRLLMRQLFQIAVANKAEHLVLTELLHQDEPENAFFRAMGFAPDLSLGTYDLDIASQCRPLCDRVVKRYAATHPHLRDVRITTLDQVDPARAADFLTKHYSGFVEQQTARLAGGHFDRSLSSAVVRPDGSLAGLTLIVSRPDNAAIFLDLVLTEPAFRNTSPAPIAMFAETIRACAGAGKTKVVFEADEHHDPFAVGFARRCGAKSPQWYRYRYAIGQTEFARRT